MWRRRVSLAAGLLLVLLALLLPTGRLVAALAGPAPERLGQLTTGSLLFKAGLLFHGLFLIGFGWFGRARGVASRQAILFRAAPRADDDGRREMTLVLIGLLGIGALLRIINLNSGLWYDEVNTLLDFVRPPARQIITSFATDNQHLLYSLLAHYSIGIFGESPWSLRLPAVLFGLGSLWALCGLGRAIASRREAILATALLTVSYHHIWFSQNARGYTGLLFWTLLGTWLFIAGLQSGRQRHWLGYVLAMTLAIYTHLAALFVVISHAIVYGWLLVRGANKEGYKGGRWRPLWAFALVGSLSFQLYALALPQAIGSVVDDGTTVPSDWTNPLWTLAETLRGLQVGFAGVGALIAAALLFGSGLLSYLRENRMVVALLVLPGLLGATVIVSLQHNFWPRFFFYALGFAILIAVRGAMVFGRIAASIAAHGAARVPLARRIGTALACMLIFLSASSLGFNYRYPKQDYLGALAYLEEQRQAGEPVVAVGLASVPYRRYYAPHLEQVATLEQLESVRARGRATWLLYTFPIYMKAHHPDILAAIENDFIVVKEFPGTVGDGTIYLCRAEPAQGNVTGRLMGTTSGR